MDEPSDLDKQTGRTGDSTARKPAAKRGAAKRGRRGITLNAGPTGNDTVTDVTDSNPIDVDPTDNDDEKKNSRLRSYVWDHFTRNLTNPLKPRAICKYCGTSYACHSKANGTTAMKTHLEVGCKKYPFRTMDKKQKTLGFEPKLGTDGVGNLVAVSFNVEACKNALAEMIIIDELPFKFVDGEAFYACGATKLGKYPR